MDEHVVAIVLDNLLQNNYGLSALEVTAVESAIVYLNKINPTKRFLSGVEPKPESGLTT